MTRYPRFRTDKEIYRRRFLEGIVAKREIRSINYKNDDGSLRHAFASCSFFDGIPGLSFRGVLDVCFSLKKLVVLE